MANSSLAISHLAISSPHQLPLLPPIYKMTNESSMSDVQEPIKTAPPEVRQIIERVWQAEKGRLDKKSLSHINDDILAIVKEAVK